MVVLINSANGVYGACHPRLALTRGEQSQRSSWTNMEPPASVLSSERRGVEYACVTSYRRHFVFKHTVAKQNCLWM